MAVFVHQPRQSQLVVNLNNEVVKMYSVNLILSHSCNDRSHIILDIWMQCIPKYSLLAIAIRTNSIFCTTILVILFSSFFLCIFSARFFFLMVLGIVNHNKRIGFISPSQRLQWLSHPFDKDFMIKHTVVILHLIPSPFKDIIVMS